MVEGEECDSLFLSLSLPPLSLSFSASLSSALTYIIIFHYIVIYINTDIDYPITANFRVESPILSFN